MMTDAHPTRERRGLLGVVSRHPLLSFFVLANALSWSAWLPYILSQNGLGIWDVTFSSQLTGILPGAFLGPITSALVVTLITDGRSGLRTWARRLWKWRVRWHWYAIAVLGVPAALVLTGVVVSGGQIMAPSITALIMYIPALLLQMVTTGLAEEPGWRDFALPRLQERFGPMRSAFILGPVWALWHMPLFLTDWGRWPEAHWSAPVTFAIFCIGFNVVMAWVFNSTGQSLPLAILAHVSVNNFQSVLWEEMFPTVGPDLVSGALAVAGVVAAVVVVIATRGRLGYRKPALEPVAEPSVGQVDETVLVGPDRRLQA